MLHFVTLLLLLSETFCNLSCLLPKTIQQHSLVSFMPSVFYRSKHYRSEILFLPHYSSISKFNSNKGVVFHCCYLKTIALECNSCCFENNFQFPYPVDWNFKYIVLDSKSFPKQWLITHEFFFSL